MLLQINREKRLDKIETAKQSITKRKKIPENIKKYFKNKKINTKAIKEAEKYDGYTLLFSTKNLPIEKIVKPYFEKDKVEKVFRSLKSVLGLRPIKHWLKERVKSHIFICYLSYLLITLLKHKLKSKNISAISALDKLSTAYKIHLKDPKTKNEFEKTVILTKEQETILKTVNKKLLPKT